MFEKLKEAIDVIIKNHPFELYEINQTMIFGQQGIEILVDYDDGPISTDALEAFHQEILTLDDETLPDHLMIEVSSVGIERPLKNEKDYQKAIGKYMYLVSNHYKGYGTLEAYTQEAITISYLEKTKKIMKTIPLTSISSARRAVKF
jgi:ribosome maturation factor RimP